MNFQYDLSKYRAQLRRDIEREINGLTEREAFELAFVPFVMGELVWDYADTVIDCAIEIGEPRFKPLSREMRDLRREYDRDKSRFIRDYNLQTEAQNLETYYEVFSSDFSTLSYVLDNHINRLHKTLPKRLKMLFKAVYQCAFVLQVLRTFEYKNCKDLAKRINFDFGTHILPGEIYQLSNVLPKYIKEQRINLNSESLTIFCNTFIAGTKQIEYIIDNQVENANVTKNTQDNSIQGQVAAIAG